MKTRLFLFLVIFGPLICTGQSEFTWDIHNMSPSDMHSKLKEMVNNTSLVQPRLSLINDAIAAQRLDLVHACFTNSFAVTDTFFTIKAMPDSEFRRKVATMMIRVPKSSAWLPDEMPGIYKTPRGNGVQEPFITTVEALLPGETLVPEMVVNSEARFKLADRLYAAMQREGVKFTEAEKAILEGGSASITPAPNASPSPPPNIPAMKPLPNLNAPPQQPPAPKASIDHKESDLKTAGRGDPAFWVPIALLVAAIGWWGMGSKKP